MGAVDILERLALVGVKLTAVDGGYLDAEGALTDELRTLIRENKAAILTLLEPVREAHGEARGNDRQPARAATLPAYPGAPQIDREAFEERAAIREYDGGYPREDAEVLAAWDVASALFRRLGGWDAHGEDRIDDRPEGGTTLPADHGVSQERAYPLTALDRCTLIAWLESIGEGDPEMQAAVLEQCERDPEARAYFLGYANGRARLDDRRHCRDCRNLSRGVCTAAKRIGALEGYRPVDDVPRRCDGFTPRGEA